MGLFIRQDENRSQLQEKLAEELRERAKVQAGGTEPNDQTKDSRYLKDMEQASNKGWVIAVVAGFIVAAIILYVVTR